LKKERYLNIIKLPQAIGDWTRIKLPEKNIDEISITQVKNFSFDMVSQGDLKTAHFFHYYFAKEWSEKVSKDLNIKTILYSIIALQESYSTFKEAIQENVVQIDFFHPEIGKFNFYLPRQTAESIINRIFGGKGQVIGKVSFTEIEKQALKAFFEENKDLIFKLWPVTKDKDKTVIEVKELEKTNSNFISEKESYIEFGLKFAIGEEEPKDILIGYKQDIFKQLLRKKKIGPQKKSRLIFLKEETLNKIKIPLRVEAGSTKITMNELKKLQVGDVVKLETTVDEPLPVVLGSKVNFLGQPGILEEKLAVQIILPEVNKEYKLERSIVIEKETPETKKKEAKEEEMLLEDKESKFEEEINFDEEKEIEEEKELEEDILGAKEEETTEEVEEKEEEEEEEEEKEEDDDLFGDDDFSWDDIDETEEI